MTATRAAEVPTTASGLIGLQKCVRYGLYPLLWALLIGCFIYARQNPEHIQAVQIVKAGTMLVLLLACEWFFPYQRRWGMTRSLLLKRDLVFFIANSITSRLLATALT